MSNFNLISTCIPIEAVATIQCPIANISVPSVKL